MRIDENEVSSGNLTISVDDALLRRLDEALAFLSKVVNPPSTAVRLAMGVPIVITKEGKIMNFELANGTVAFIPVHTVDAAGGVVPAPTGDVFTAVSSDATKMTAVMGVMPTGGPLAGAVAVVLTPLVKLASALTVTMTDSAALTTDVQTVDIVGDLTPKAIALDLVDVVLMKQPIPAA